MYVNKDEVTENTLVLDGVDPIDAKIEFLKQKINELKAEIAQLEQLVEQ